jgi:hypothetical protein
MGLLDDAIREHLELKRRGGADPGELERLEREALGPVRRGPQEGFDAPASDESLQGALAEEPPETWAGSRDEFIDQGAELEDGDEFEEWEPAEHGSIQGAVPVEPDTAAPATPAPPVPAEAAPAGGSLDENDFLEQETVEHDVEAEHGEEAERDDMLEETPEFLQDTPDHDRLWFEQRPPRDFDLDG